MRQICRFSLWAALLLSFGRTLGAAEPTGAPGDVPADKPAVAAADRPVGEKPIPTELDDVPEPLRPLRARSSREEDRVQALALFAAGRVAEQKQDFPRALRLYERSYRFDPDALAALREIVPLAFNLNRQAEAVRYALILAERDATDPVLLRRLAMYLTEEGDNERALRLYEKALALLPKSGDKPIADAPAEKSPRGKKGAEKQAADRILLSMEMGRLYFLAKQYEQAADRFAEVVAALEHPKDHGLDAAMEKTVLNKPELTYQLFGESFLEAGRMDAALAAFEKSHSIKANDALYAFNQARVAAKRKQQAQALAKLQVFFDKHSSAAGTGPYELLADLLAQLGLENQLIARLETLHKAEPQNIPLAYFLAERYFKDGSLDKAEPIYLELIETRKNRPPIEAYQALVKLYHQQKDAAKLLNTLGEAVGKTGNLATLGDSGKALGSDEAMTKAIVAEGQKQFEADAAKLPFGQRLAVALLALSVKDFATSNRFFEAALAAENAKKSETLLTWGLDLFIANQHADAIKVFERGINEKILPENNPTLYYYLAGALAISDRADDALAAAAKALELQKDSPRFQSRVAWIQYHAKRYDAARQTYQEVIDKFDKAQESPDTRDAMRDARLAISNICVLEHKLEESEEWIEQVLDEFPEDVGALNDLGYLWADGGKHLDRALAMIQLAVEREPKNMAYRDSLGWVLFRLGRHNEALAELRIVASVEKPDATILDHLADVLSAAGDKPGAIEHWNRAVEGFDKSAEAEKARHVREKIAKAQQELDKQAAEEKAAGEKAPVEKAPEEKDPDAQTSGDKGDEKATGDESSN